MGRLAILACLLACACSGPMRGFSDDGLPDAPVLDMQDAASDATAAADTIEAIPPDVAQLDAMAETATDTGLPAWCVAGQSCLCNYCNPGELCSGVTCYQPTDSGPPDMGPQTPPQVVVECWSMLCMRYNALARQLCPVGATMPPSDSDIQSEAIAVQCRDPMTGVEMSTNLLTDSQNCGGCGAACGVGTNNVQGWCSCGECVWQ